MKRDHIAMVALVIIPLYLLTLVNIVWPNQAVSADENRTLKQRPAFSLKALANGSYTLEFEEFFSDQFPFRSFFVQTNQQLTDLIKKPFAGDVEIIEGSDDEVDLGEGERIEPDPEDIVVLPTPTPAPSGESTTTTEPTEETSETTRDPVPTPTPEPTPTPPSVEGPVETISGVIIVENRAMELFYFSESRTERYVTLVNRLQSQLTNSQVYSLVAPTAVEFYSPESYHDLSSSQIDAIANIYGRLDSSIETVDAYRSIVSRWEDYLYFRTDHHWTARGAYCAYEAFGAVAGYEPLPLDRFETGIVPGDFLGSLYRYTKSSKLKNNPDFVEYFLPTVSSEGIAFTDTTMAQGYRIQAVHTTVESSNKYLAFIQGDNPLVQFKTDLTNGKKIVVLKESFGNALVPFLLNHYEEVYVIDPRSLSADLPAFIEQHGIQDVLIVNYAFAVTNTKWLDGFEAMIR